MCGRFALTETPEVVAAFFGTAGGLRFPPRYNVAPTQPLVVVRLEAGQRRMALLRWGLVPGWVKDPASFALVINARSEEALDKPSFRNALRYRRCLVPASGFYEWRRGPGKTRQAYWLRPRRGGPIAFAGLWETWMGRNGEEVDTGAILTTAANAALAPIHDRMPVVIKEEDFDLWLSGRALTAAELARLMQPVEDDFFEIVPVGAAINRADADGPDLQAPAAPEPEDSEDDPQGRLF